MSTIRLWPLTRSAFAPNISNCLRPPTTQMDLIKLILKLNAYPMVDGMIVRLLLDTTEQIDVDSVINKIIPEKDVDGLSRENAGRLARGELTDTIIPCTPRACLYLVGETVTKVAGKEVVVLGRRQNFSIASA